MYSRVTSYDNQSRGIRLNPRPLTENAQSEKIPVRSFTDSFAYERFNNMGKNQTYDKTSVIEQEQSASEITDGLSKEDVQTSEHQSQENSNNDDRRAIALSRFKGLLDTDTILLIVLAAMIALSADTTNDKLTPIALLAILFL